MSSVVAKETTPRRLPSQPFLRSAGRRARRGVEALAAERNQLLSLTRLALDPQKPVLESATRRYWELAISEEIAEAKSVSLSDLRDFDFGPLELTRTIVARWLTRAPR